MVIERLGGSGNNGSTGVRETTDFERHQQSILQLKQDIQTHWTICDSPSTDKKAKNDRTTRTLNLILTHQKIPLPKEGQIPEPNINDLRRLLNGEITQQRPFRNDEKIELILAALLTKKDSPIGSVFRDIPSGLRTKPQANFFMSVFLPFLKDPKAVKQSDLTVLRTQNVSRPPQDSRLTARIHRVQPDRRTTQHKTLVNFFNRRSIERQLNCA